MKKILKRLIVPAIVITFVIFLYRYNPHKVDIYFLKYRSTIPTWGLILYTLSIGFFIGAIMFLTPLISYRQKLKELRCKFDKLSTQLAFEEDIIEDDEIIE